MMEFEPIQIEPAYRKVATALIDKIVGRSLATGDRLPSETELARQFGVNRSTVREALRELQTSGLLGRQRGSKLMIVTRPEHQVVAGGISRALALHDITFFDVWEALTLLEPPLAETAARRRSAIDLKAIQRSAAEFADDHSDTVLAVVKVSDFFRRVGEATHNPALQLAQEPLIQLLEPSLPAMMDRVPQSRARIVSAQARICEALKARDAKLAGTWMAKHILDFKKGYEVARISLQGLVSEGPS